MKRPPIGTEMWHVLEHLYYVPNHAAPVLEYVVRPAIVKGYFEGGYTQVHVVGPNAKGYPTPSFYKMGEIGQHLFYTRAEAEALAEQKTDRYEKTWSWMGPPEVPMRRPWRNKEGNR